MVSDEDVERAAVHDLSQSSPRSNGFSSVDILRDLQEVKAAACPRTPPALRSSIVSSSQPSASRSSRGSHAGWPSFIRYGRVCSAFFFVPFIFSGRPRPWPVQSYIATTSWSKSFELNFGSLAFSRLTLHQGAREDVLEGQLFIGRLPRQDRRRQRGDLENRPLSDALLVLLPALLQLQPHVRLHSLSA